MSVFATPCIYMADQQAQVEIEVVEASDSAVPPAPPPPAPPNQLFLGKKRGGSGETV